jgi:alpha-1,2-mannosyltransferase
VPVALLAARQWTALAWMIAAGASLSLASFLVFGLDFWMEYVAMTRRLTEPFMLDIWASRASRIHISPFVAGRILHLPDGAASALQFGAMALAAGAVWFAFRRYPSSDARTAVLMAGTLLMSPYAVNYDLLLLMPAAVMLYRQAAATKFYAGEALVYPVLWLLPSAMFSFNGRLPIAPLVVLAFGFFAMLRLRTQPVR